MLHVNEDNNDELFRKAAEDFFLKAENPDWENVSHKMESGTGHEMPDLKKKEKYLLPVVFFKNLFNTSWYNKWFPFLNRSGKSKKKIERALYTIGGNMQLCNCYSAPPVHLLLQKRGLYRILN